MSRYYKRVPWARTTICSVVCLLFATVTLSLAREAQPASSDAAAGIVALESRWRVHFDGSAAAPAGFDQQTAYVPLKGGPLVAIDLDEGAVRWHVALATPFTPATGDGLVFVFAAEDNSLLAIDQRTGRQAWRTPLPQPLSGPAYWESGWVVASTVAGDLVALQAEDGRILWRISLGAALAVRPSSAGDRLHVALRDGRVAAVGLETGVVHWNVAVQGEITGMLALDEQLLVGTRANLLHSLSADRGRPRWTQKAGADVVGAPAADAEHIYYVAFDNVLRALHRRNGNLRWTRNLPSRPTAGPLLADDVVLVPYSTGDIGAFAAISGAPTFTIRVVGELGSAPFLRENVRPTAPRLVALTRGGALEGFAPPFEPVPVPLGELPGVKTGGN